MQKNNWLRLGMAGIILSGLGAGTVLQGCGDDDVTPLDAGTDTAPTNTTTATGTGTVPDSSVPDTFVPPVPESQKIIFVHAANFLGAAFEANTAAPALNGSVRLCLKAGPEGTNPFLPVPPLPNTASTLPGGAKFTGLLRGTGGVLPARTDFSTTRLEGYALNAQALQARGVTNTSCGDLFTKGFGVDGGAGDGGTPLVEGQDYVKVGVIPSGTFTPDSTFVVSVTGCAANAPTEVATRCGAGYAPATGNLKLNIVKLDRGAVGAAELGAQFIHAASAVEGVLPTPPPVLPGVVTPGDGGADAGAAKLFSTTPVAFDGAKVTPLVKLSGVNVTTDRLTLNPAVPELSQYTFGSAVILTAAQTPVALGSGFVFIAVGEPQRPPTDGNLALHFLAFPTNPVVPPLTQ